MYHHPILTPVITPLSIPGKVSMLQEQKAIPVYLWIKQKNGLINHKIHSANPNWSHLIMNLSRKANSCAAYFYTLHKSEQYSPRHELFSLLFGVIWKLRPLAIHTHKHFAPESYIFYSAAISKVYSFFLDTRYMYSFELKDLKQYMVGVPCKKAVFFVSRSDFEKKQLSTWRFDLFALTVFWPQILASCFNRSGVFLKALV